MTVTTATIESRLQRNRAIEQSNVKVTVPAGETSLWIPVPDQAVITAIPGVGGSMLVEATFSLPSVVEADNTNSTSNATAFEWDAGTVTAKANQLLERATAVRFTATTATGVGEVAR